MEEHLEIINKFYNSFAARDADGMISCYHSDVVFSDPAFVDLNAEDAGMMWRMLLSRGSDLVITHKDVWAKGDKGGAYWEAKYPFSKTGRRVHNKISAEFTFKDGLIVQHNDYFNFWRWSSMALGAPGYLLGWTPFLKGKVRSQVVTFLAEFKKAQKA